MHANGRTVLSVVIAAILILLGAAIPAANFGTSVSASNGRPSPGQQGWRLAQPVTYENLTIFPVVAAQDADTSEFATLDEALASGEAVVTEQGNYLRRTRDGVVPPNFPAGAQVNQLVLVNRGKRPLVLLAGEVVSGGKQDRIIGKDRIVPVGAAPLPLDVFCVEHGRWTGASEQFSAGNLMVHPSVREKAAVEQDQTQVWAAVRGEAAPVGSVSQSVTVESSAAPLITSRNLSTVIAGDAPTQSYQKIYKSSPIGASVETFSEEVQRRFARATSGLKGERVVGVVVAFGGEVAWSDIFASSGLFDSYWPKLLRSYAVEAMTRPAFRKAASLDDARDFLRPATGHIEEESEPGVYRWRKQSEGRLSEIELDALAPRPLTLHWLRVLRAD
ncbi:MAG TPA: DUF6569 family protein [Candidatus Acidoferrales bacterium]|nr:DUF6569 family protein [Candidatus Acidoferrales bacterium]